MTDIETLARRVREIKQKQFARDQRMEHVRAVRAGEVQNVIPGMLPNKWPRSTVANHIDIAARVISESSGTLPTVKCTSGRDSSERQKKYALKRTYIANHYVQASRLKTNLLTGADWFETYGFLPFVVEPNFDKLDMAGVGPRIAVENPMNCYYEMTAWGRVKTFFKVFDEPLQDLANRFPDARAKLLAQNRGNDSNVRVEIVWWMDDDEYVLFAPTRGNTVLTRMPNMLGRCPVFVAERPRFDSQTRGAFDDVVWIQLLRARLAMLSLRGIEQSINAPVVTPLDVPKMVFGPNQQIRTSDPGGVHRVPLEISPLSVQMPEIMQQEIFVAARFPEGATGKSPGSVVTGAGMDALMNTIDSRVAASQMLIGEKLSEAIACCFEMDEKLWPGTVRQMRVNLNGETYSDTYKPRDDIKGVYQVDVTYGMLAGMDKNRAMVFLLQGRTDNLFSRQMVLHEMPFDINPDEVQREVREEQIEDGMMQGLVSALAATGQMLANGMDPTKVIQAGVDARKAIERGTSIAEAVEKALVQKPTPATGSQAPGEESQPGSAPPLPGASGPPGLMPPGGGPLSPPGGGPPQAPGGTPNARDLLAQLTASRMGGRQG